MYQYKVLPFGLSLSPHVFTKVTESTLALLKEVGIRILNYLDDWLIVAQSQEQLCDHRDLVLWHLSLNGKEAFPCAENLFSWYGVGIGQHDGVSYQRVHPISVELPEILQGQDGGTTETISEAPGAFGIRSHGYGVWIAPYETISALVAQPSPKMGMAPWYTWRDHHADVLTHIQPLIRPCLSTGWGALRTSVPACSCHDTCLQDRLGLHLQWTGCLGFVH